MANELGDFLRTRRARLDAADLGLVRGARRRVPGLRREEVAQLAGVSVDYYVRMEQGRVPGVSDAILDAVASALRLTADERAHLGRLARHRPAPPRPAPPQVLRPEVRWLLQTLDRVPALVLGRRMQILGWNRLAAALIVDLDALPAAERNLIRLMFLAPALRELFDDWPACARENVANLRLDAGLHPDDPQLAALVGELSVKSPEFRRLWAEHTVSGRSPKVKIMHHPLVGRLDLAAEILALEDGPMLVTYTPEPGSASEDALRLLDSLHRPLVGPERAGRGPHRHERQQQ